MTPPRPHAQAGNVEDVTKDLAKAGGLVTREQPLARAAALHVPFASQPVALR